MPTVKSDIKPAAVLPRFRGKSGGKKLLFFPAELWTSQGGEAGEWRVMRGDAWVKRDGETCSFFDIEGVTLLIMREACKGLDVPVPELVRPAPPDLPRGTRVRVYSRLGLDRVSFTASAPFQNDVGEWCVLVAQEPKPMLCRDVERVDDVGTRRDICD